MLKRDMNYRLSILIMQQYQIFQLAVTFHSR